MYLLDGHVILTPADVGDCEFSLLRRIAEHRGLIAPTTPAQFLAERAGSLEREQRRRLTRTYARDYPRAFTDLRHGRASSLAELRAQHEATVSELASMRMVAAGTLLVDLAAEVILASSPAVVGAGTVADTVFDRFARAGDLARLGAHAYAVHVATGREATYGYLHMNNDRRVEYSGPELQTVTHPRLAHLTSLARAALEHPEPWPWEAAGVRACGFCPWCKQAATFARDVSTVWGVREHSRNALRAAGIATIDQLAHARTAPDSIDAFSWSRFQTRARLQLEQESTGRAAFLLHDPAAIEALPEPDPGDIFFDFEGDPLWVEKNRFEWGLEFLFGYIEADTGEYTALWSRDQGEERRAFATFVDYLQRRRRTHPGMHVYHFAFYEPAAMRRLARRHRIKQKEVGELLEAGLFIDLYETVKAGVHTSGSSYGLKALEPLFMGEELRTADVGDGADAVVAFGRAMAARRDGDEATWREITADLAEYNRYDCLATHRLRDWLLALHTRGEDGDQAALARELLGASTLEGELMVTPLQEPREDLTNLSLSTPGFDEPGIFYISSGNSRDALGAQHKVHELLGRPGSGTALAPGGDLLVVYGDPSAPITDSRALTARRARLGECEAVGSDIRLTLEETTPAHDPGVNTLTPRYLDTRVPPPDAQGILKAAKKVRYTLITGPAGSGKTALTQEVLGQTPGAVVIDDAHVRTLEEALTILDGAQYAIVAGDPALATPIHRRGLPVDLAGGPLLSWLLGESGATIAEHRTVEHTGRFFPELGRVVEQFVYDGAPVLAAPAHSVRLLPGELTGLQVQRVDHRGNRGTSPEEAGAIVKLVTRLFSESPLAEADILVTAAADAQVLLLRRELAGWPAVRVESVAGAAGADTAVSIISLGASTLADLPRGQMPLARHVLGGAITRAREAAFVVCSAHLLEQLPPRAGMFPDVARAASLLS